MLARLGSTFGVAGWIKVRSFTDPTENVLDYEVWQLEQRGQWVATRVLESRVTARDILVKLENVGSREAAQKLAGTQVGVWRSELPSIAADRYYWDDLIGLEAYAPSGEGLGRIDHIIEMPAHGVLVIQGARQHLVPLVRERIIAVDLAAGRITLDWMPDWLAP